MILGKNIGEISDDCEFCAEFRGKETPFLLSLRMNGISNRILLDRDNVVSFVGLGPIALGYCLICPLHHYQCLADVPKEVLVEMDRQRRILSDAIRSYHGSVSCFEHGSRSKEFKCGACYDHAHLHLIGGAPALRTAAATRYPECRVDGIVELPNYCNELTEYLFLMSDDESSFVYRASENVPSQFFRRCWAESLGLSNCEYDWALNPNFELMRQSVEFFRNADLE